MDRRSLLALLGIVAVAPSELLAKAAPDPEMRAVPAGWHRVLDTHLMIQWGTADQDGDAVFPIEFTQILTVCARVRGDDAPSLVQGATTAGAKVLPGADWLALGVAKP